MGSRRGALLLVAVATDLARGEICNWLTIPALLLALGTGLAEGGGEGLGLAAWGGLVGGAIFLVPFLLGAMGGGDVKLMAALGAWAGAAFVLKTAFYACLLGGGWALLAMAKSGQLGAGLLDLGRFVRGLATPGLAAPPPRDLGLAPLPFGLCIAGGAAWARFGDLLPRLGA